MRIYIIAVVVVTVIGAATAAVNGLINYGKTLGRVESQETIIALQKATGELGLIINKSEGDLAEKARNAQDSEEDRIDAIQTTSLQAEQIADFEKLLYTLRQESRDKDMLVASLRSANLRVVSIDSIISVYDRARNSPELAPSVSTIILQKELPEVTGSDINTIIKRTVGSYNACAIKFNNLWPTCERLIESKQEKPAD